MKSTHLPEVSGAIVEVTGSLVVDTNLRDVQSYALTLAADSAATEATVSGDLEATPNASGHQKLTIKVWNADGATPGASAVKVAWLAFGK